jgi:hypothetical protein
MLRGTASAAANFFREQVDVRTSTYDANAANDVRETAFDVSLPAAAAPPATATTDGGGTGGGGAFDPLLLGLCAYLWARRPPRGPTRDRARVPESDRPIPPRRPV